MSDISASASIDVSIDIPAPPHLPDIGLPPHGPPPPPPPGAPPDTSGARAPHRSRSSAAAAKSRNPDPVGELRFQVKIEGEDITIGEFSECTGLTLEYDVMEYQEGGEQRFVHKLRGGLKYPNLVLKRGVTYEEALLKWFFERKDRGHRGTITLNLLGDDGQQVRTWSFAQAFPVKWSGPSFNAKSTNVATETLEIAHHGFVTHP